MKNLPAYIGILFMLTTLLTAWFFYKAANNSKRSFLISLGWLALQAIISLKGFYIVTDTAPPRFALLLFPPVILIIILFITRNGRKYIDKLDIKHLTLLHIVRIPVEIVLLLLCSYKTVPVLMTFEGRNFDIFSGITAPLILYFGFIKKNISFKILLAWNIICLGLLMNIVVNAILSAPFPFQQFGFDQPNIAILYFPFVWLPCFVVPLVLFAHLASIRLIAIKKEGQE